MKFTIDQIAKAFVVGTMIAGAAIVATAVIPLTPSLARGFSGPPTVCRPPVDANGWTVFGTPHKIYYFSSSQGSDSYTATQAQNPATPWATIGGGATHLLATATADNGLPDWFLLKKGDTFPPNPPGDAGYPASGENCANPMVFDAYDPAFPGVVDPYDGLSVTSITCSGTTEVVNTQTQTWTGTPNVDIVQELPGAFNGEALQVTVNSPTQIQFTVASCPTSSDTLHGRIALARPIVEVNYGNQCYPKSEFPTYGSYIFFGGWRCSGYQADPSNSSFSNLAWLNQYGPAGFVNTVATVTGVTFEDNEWDFLTGGSIDFGASANTSSAYLSLRRNVNKTFGTYVSTTNYLEVYENIYAFSGWSPIYNAAQPVTINATGSPAVFTWGSSLPLLFGNDGAGHCSQVTFTAASLPTYSIAATMTSGGGELISATNNFVAQQEVILTGAGLPAGITAGTPYYVYNGDNTLSTSAFKITTTPTGSTPLVYTGTGSGTVAASLGGSLNANTFSPIFFVVGISGGTFSVDLNCTGPGISLSGAGSSVEAYWDGSDAQTGYNGAYPQPSEFQHANYLQNAANAGSGVPNITLLGNIFAFISGAACECQGWEHGNLLEQSPIGMSGTKAGAIPLNLDYLTDYNGLIEIAPYYTTPVPYNGGDWGFPLAPRLGKYTLDHNLLAYTSDGNGGNKGILPGSNNNYPDGTTYLTSNVACGIVTPISATQGQPVTFGAIVTQGSGYSPLHQVNEYVTATQDGVQTVALTGHGSGFGAAVWIDGTSNQLVGMDLEYNINGQGYQVGDLVAPNGNSQIGTVGSGGSIPASAVQGPGFLVQLGTAFTAGSAASGQNTLAFPPYYLSWLTNGMTVWDNHSGGGSYTYVPSGTTVTGTAITTPATFSGTISGSVVTASSVTGALAVGQQINGAGVTPGSFIASFGTGSGGAGTYNLNQNGATIGSAEPMTATIETVTISANLNNSVPNGATIRFANGGSGYVAPISASLSGGSGINLLESQIVVGTGGNVLAVYPLASYGLGYTTSDILSPVLTHTTAAQVPVTEVVNNVMTNNTYKAANCQNLQLGGDQLNYYQQPNSVAPAGDTNPLFSATPPTDIAGTYFCQLPYGYSAPVPASLTIYTTGCEQGWMAAQGMQSKALWDPNLTSFSLLNWARPQFGILNPPGSPLEYEYLLKRDFDPTSNDNSPAFLDQAA